jgi:hypothetical protein
MKYKFIFGMICTLASMHACAQSINPAIINSAGGTASIGGNTYEWSIGEMVLVNTATAGNITITQGLLQPSKPSSGVGLSESQFIFDHVTIYPNPTENLFYLSADFNDKGEIHTLLYDMNGKIIDDKKIPADGQPVKIAYNISALAAGNYMMVVSFTPTYDAKKSIKAAYKIEKSN